MKNIILFILMNLYGLSLHAQTCCSGGIPIASNIGFTTQSTGTLVASFHYEHNFLNDLLSEDVNLGESNRVRKTNSFLWRFGYTIKRKWSIESLFPYIIQKREILQNSGGYDKEQSEGIGDIVLLIKYDLIQNQTWNLNIGLGPKFATADSEKTNKSGLLLIKDLQPGTGAMDLISRLAFTFSPSVRPSITTYLSAIHSMKGTDESYLITQSYKFGNDIQLFAGISDQIFIKDLPFYPSLGLRYRSAFQDKVNDVSIPNTGGKWLFLRTNIGFDVSKPLRIISTFEWPLKAKVDGTQLSPTYIFNIGLFANFSIFSHKEIILP